MSVSGLCLDGLSVRRGDFRLGPIDLNVPAGCCLVVQGANGAGKTTLLEAVAGFTRVQGGTVRLHGRDITARPPELRGIAYVPQDLALFPHLSVEGNLAFGLSGSRPWKRERLEWLLDEFNLSALRANYPQELSRGQRQRLALGRALAMEPALVLLDEPSVSLDSPGREALHFGVHKLLNEHNLPVLYATHDRTEAAMLEDHIAVLDSGRLLQVGRYADVLARPADIRVAGQMGVDNLWPARVLAASALGLRLEIEGRTFESALIDVPEGRLQIGLCAGDVELSRSPTPGTNNTLEVAITALQSIGPLKMLHLDGLSRLRALAPGWWARDLAVGTYLWARLPPEALRPIPVNPTIKDNGARSRSEP